MTVTGRPELVYEDDQILVVNKPAGIATMGVAPDKPSLLAQVQQYLIAAPASSTCDAYTTSEHKPFVAIVNRLDFPVSGIVVVAKTPVAANHLHTQFANRQVKKTYHALVGFITRNSSRPQTADDIRYPSNMPKQTPFTLKTNDTIELENWIVKSKRHRKVKIVDPPDTQAQYARLRLQVLAKTEHVALLEVKLLTGRKHQIRAQLAHYGVPILGDYKYKSPETFPSGIALVSKSVSISHPETNRECRWEIDYPNVWQHHLPIRS